MVLLEEAYAEQGKRLAKLRKEHGFSQAALDVTRQAVSSWERGAAFPSMEKLLKLCRLYQVDLSVLTGQGEPEESDEHGEPNEPEESGEPDEPDELEELDGPGKEPGKPARRKKFLWPVCLLAACIAVCATIVLIVYARPWDRNGQNETEVVPITDLEQKQIEILPEDYIEFDP